MSSCVERREWRCSIYVVLLCVDMLSFCLCSKSVTDIDIAWQCRSLSSLFASFPAPHVSQSLLFTFLFPKAISEIARLAHLFLQLLLSSALDSSDTVERLADKGRRYKRNGRELNS